MKTTVEVEKSGWVKVLNSARTTVGKIAIDKEPSEEFKKGILLAEHSPIRRLKISWKWEGLFSWVSVHFVRHKNGIEHWVKTQRTDRTSHKINRNNLPQNAQVNHEAEANAQALINISRKRLCFLASAETREAWKEVRAQVAEQEPVLASVMVKECVYRGFCPEMKPCGYSETPRFLEELEEYRGGRK